MKPETYYAMAPWLVASGTLGMGTLIQGIHLFPAIVMAALSGLAYWWLESWIETMLS